MAKTTATAANLATCADRRAELRSLANDYLAQADELLTPEPPRLIAVGGFSGSGKSTLAFGLAPSAGAPPGAVVIRSDEIRKKLCGVAPLERLAPEGYTDEMSKRVYATLMTEADKVVRSGYVAIADAVFAESADRNAIEHVARAAGVPFVGLWLEAPAGVLIVRVDGRGPDASDAGGEVVRRQLAYRLDDVRWHRVDASGTRQQLWDDVGKIIHDLS